MPQPPEKIDNAKVIRWSVIDSRHRPTGGCRHIADGLTQGSASGLAICQYDGATDYYLFYCDSSWQTVNDTWHGSLEEALRQAEFEYEGVTATWNVTQ